MLYFADTQLHASSYSTEYEENCICYAEK